MPSSRTAILWLLEPENWACQLLRRRSGSLTTLGCSSTPPGVASFLKKVDPYCSAAIDKPIAFLAIAIGL